MGNYNNGNRIGIHCKMDNVGNCESKDYDNDTNNKKQKKK